MHYEFANLNGVRVKNCINQCADNQFLIQDQGNSSEYLPGGCIDNCAAGGLKTWDLNGDKKCVSDCIYYIDEH